MDFATTGQALQVAGRMKVEPVTGPATASRHRLSNACPLAGACQEPHGLGGPPLKLVPGLPGESEAAPRRFHMASIFAMRFDSGACGRVNHTRPSGSRWDSD